jgi:hypothetical protein
MIVAYGGSVAPVGWLECNGQSTAAYPILGSVVGASVPDLRGEFIRGWDHGRGVDSGRSIRSYQADEFRSHNHSMGGICYPHGPISDPPGGGNSHGHAWPSTGNAGGNETRPRNIALMYIIKHD